MWYMNATADRTDRVVLGVIVTAEKVPTRRELSVLTNRSLRTVQKSVERLEARGFIARAPHTARGLEVVALP